MDTKAPPFEFRRHQEKPKFGHRRRQLFRRWPEPLRDARCSSDELVTVSKGFQRRLALVAVALANLAALELAFLVTAPVAGRLQFVLSRIGLEPRVAVLSLIPVRQAVAGAALGLAQWLILRRRIPRVGGWPVATTVGAVLGAPFLIVIAVAFQLFEPPKLSQTESLAFAALNGSATGICIALVQMSVLRRRVAGTHVWLVAGLLGYGLGAVSTMALSIYAFLPFELNAAVTGGILGAVTGLAFLRLLGRERTPPVVVRHADARA